MQYKLIIVQTLSRVGFFPSKVAFTALRSHNFTRAGYVATLLRSFVGLQLRHQLPPFLAQAPTGAV